MYRAKVAELRAIVRRNPDGPEPYPTLIREFCAVIGREVPAIETAHAIDWACRRPAAASNTCRSNAPRRARP